MSWLRAVGRRDRGHLTRRVALAALATILHAPLGWAQAPVWQLVITGRVTRVQTYSVEALASMPALQVTAAAQGTSQSSFVGTPLWPLIAAAGPIDGPDPGSRLQHVFLARGRDGYAVAVAIGEIDPEFEGKPVIVAYKQDGALLPTPRLVMPGDRWAGRNVRDLAVIEVF